MKLLNDAFDLEAFFKKLDKKALLIADYDGTLAPFVENRMQAFPYAGVEERMEKLLHIKHLRFVILSGRSLEDLEKLLFKFPTLELWGSHGLERKINGDYINYLDQKMALNTIEKAKTICLQFTDERHCEQKPFGLAFHWRNMDKEDANYIAFSIKAGWEKFMDNELFEIHSFDGGIELRPKSWNKGSSVQILLQETAKTSAIAYLGDDFTDEEGFEKLGSLGLKILVKDKLRPTYADLLLIPPLELLAFLDRWIFASHKAFYAPK